MCGKGRMRRHLVSHAKNNFVRFARPNLRLIRIASEGKVKTVWICAKCLKRGRVQPVLRRSLARPAAGERAG